MEDIALYNMEPSDIPEVYEIEKMSFKTPWSKQAFYDEIDKNASARYIVAKLGKKVAGYGGLWVILDEGHITNIAVHPDFRGKHIGDMLVRGLIDIAVNEGLQSLTLEVRFSNDIAQNLYKKYGFESAGIRPGYYSDTGEDAIIMWKRNIP